MKVHQQKVEDWRNAWVMVPLDAGVALLSALG